MNPRGIDWASWMRRWEAQQNGHMPDREERFEVIVAAVRSHCGASPRILDLGCGPGSLAARLSRAIPGGRIIGVDRDPVLLELGRHAMTGHHRVALADADLGDPDLPRVGDNFDAAVSTTALHWLGLDALRQLYRSLAVMIKPGGLFLNGDRHRGTGAQVLDTLVHNMREPSAAAAVAVEAAETWEQWWAAVGAEAGFAAHVRERRVRHADHPHDERAPTLLDHTASLREAGFAEVGSLWQHLEDRVLAAIR